MPTSTVSGRRTITNTYMCLRARMTTGKSKLSASVAGLQDQNTGITSTAQEEGPRTVLSLYHCDQVYASESSDMMHLSQRQATRFNVKQPLISSKQMNASIS